MGKRAYLTLPTVGVRGTASLTNAFAYTDCAASPRSDQRRAQQGQVRDERKFADPHAFNVMRNSADQLAFGSRPHMCVGPHLAGLEMNAIFGALATRVSRFRIQQEAPSCKVACPTR
jgi:hypothetical protein